MKSKLFQRRRATSALLLAGAAMLSIPPGARAASNRVGSYQKRDDVREFIASLVRRHGFSAEQLSRSFAQVRRQSDALRLIAPATSGFKRSWSAYRARFIDQSRIEGGIEFWNQYRAALERAASIYGVPAEVIVAIIGVETIYGRVTGGFPVLDTLTTLAFDYPRRAEFFRGELESYLLLGRDGVLDLTDTKGSYAGAIGLPQFMPSSIRRFAVDFDKDGRIDLRNSAVDAIGSVARFLVEHGWVPGAQSHYRARIEANAQLGPLIAQGIEPSFNAAQLSGSGVGVVGNVPEGTRLALVDLPNGDDPPDYLLGARNFYVVTRYNRSSFYATAVLELAQELRAGR
ncbi:MAG: lytic murein transglycosylase B [Quisquiliibacterium sp.]